MNRNLAKWIVGIALVASVPAMGRCGAAEPVELPRLSEVIHLLKSHFVDRDRLDEELINEASVAGILQALGQGAMILPAQPQPTNEVGAARAHAGPALARAELIEPDIGYIRIADVTEETVLAVDAELRKFAQQKAAGYVLDLRFADGQDYAAAAAVAGRFLEDGQELFSINSADNGVAQYRSSAPADAATLRAAGLSSAPLMLLVNAETTGSAEALAGALRAQDRGIVIGATTAGSAASWKDFKLSDGRILRVATAKVVLPARGEKSESGTPIFPAGIKPDVPVQMDPKIEREVVLAAQTNMTLTASLQPRQKKKAITEAELVRAFRGEAIDAPPGSAPQEEGQIQHVRDVVLQRAVDILKGIRVLLSWR